MELLNKHFFPSSVREEVGFKENSMYRFDLIERLRDRDENCKDRILI